MAKKKRFPKKIAGIKVPKFLRKSNLLRTVLASSTGRDLMAQALTAAAAAAAAVLVRDRDKVMATGKKAGKKGAEAVGLAADAVQSAASAAVGVVADTAKSLLPDDASSDSDKSRAAAKEARRH